MKRLDVVLAPHRLQEVQRALIAIGLEDWVVSNVVTAEGRTRFAVEIMTDEPGMDRVLAVLEQLGPPTEHLEILVVSVVGFASVDHSDQFACAFAEAALEPHWNA